MIRGGLVVVVVACCILSCSRDKPDASRVRETGSVLVHVVVPAPDKLLKALSPSPPRVTRSALS